MAAKIEGKTEGCTFTWRIENVSNCWWLEEGEFIHSPQFTANAIKETKWSLRLFLMGDESENGVDIYLQREEDSSGPDVIEVVYQLAFLDKHGSILEEKTSFNNKCLKNYCKGYLNFEERKRIFFTERKSFLPEDILTVQCTIWRSDEKPIKSNHVFATTVMKVKRRSFAWRVDKISTLTSGIRNKFEDNLITLGLSLNDNLNRLDIDITSLDERISYISCNTLVVDSEGERDCWNTRKYSNRYLKKKVLSSFLVFPLIFMENKSKYFPNDVLSLEFEFAVSTVEHFECGKNVAKLENGVGGKEKYQNVAVLIDELKLMYNEGIFSDIELRTPTKTFPAHKCILSARSPVFKKMNQETQNIGQVDINDFDDDTVQRMLVYIYTDSLGDMQFASVSKLFKIADKYQISSLKIRCSSFLQMNLSPTNACDVLVLADLHSDEDLKNAVQDYILGKPKQIFYSQNWKDLMSTHLKLAADLMLRKITKNKVNI